MAANSSRFFAYFFSLPKNFAKILGRNFGAVVPEGRPRFYPPKNQSNPGEFAKKIAKDEKVRRSYVYI